MTNDSEFKRVLTLFPVTLFGLAYLVPMTVFTTYGIVTQLTKGMLPAAYVITLITMLFTAYSYGRMVKAYPLAGSAYTYTQKSFNPHVGFLVGWALLLDYLFLPMINYLVIGIYLSAEFPSVPMWVWVILFIAIVTVLNIRGIKIVTNLNFLIIAYQAIVIVVFAILTIRGLYMGEGAGTLFSIKPFFNPDVPSSLIFSGSAILALSFLGFDAVTTLSEETINAKRVIPKAIFLVTIIGGVLFIIVSYLGNMVYPNYNAFTDVNSAGLEIAAFIGGNFFKAMFLAGMVVGGFGSAMSSHASVSRLLFAMGRDSIFPKKSFAYLHPKFKTPVFSTLVVSILALSSLIFGLATVSSFISFGALIAFTFVNLSVVAHYYIRKGRRSFKQTILYLVLPLIGVVLTIWLWTSLSKDALYLGIGWVILGIIYLTFLTNMFRQRPPELTFDGDQGGVEESV